MTSAVATVVALMRDLPATLNLVGLGEALLACGSADRLWAEHVGPMETEPARAAATRDITRWRALGWEAVTVLDPEYPDLIRAARRSPALLMAEGQLVTDEYAVAIVGARRASPAGRDFANSLARGLVDRDVTVVSGLAAGIDTAAMTAAVEVGGRVVAVIGTGLDRTYPAVNAELRARILRHGGLVLSQFLPGFPGAAWSFPARNRTMSAYVQATVIAEAGEQSGTRHLAAEAVAHGRRLVLHRVVAEDTSWGQELVGHPAVFVVDTAGEAIEVLERIAAADEAVRGRLAPATVDMAW